MNFFRELRPSVKLVIILLAAAIPFGAFVLLRSSDTPPAEVTPIPSDSPATDLNFPFGTSTTTTTTINPFPTTTPVVVRPTTKAVVKPQCSDGRDNDRDGRIDLRDRGCSSASDRSEAHTVATTLRATTTTRCTPRAYPLPVVTCPSN